MKISIIKDTETLRYAANELAKYLKMMDDEVDASICVGNAQSDGITVGLLQDLGLSCDGVDDAMLDDVTDVKIENLCGHIAGSNERSALFGVYQYLRSAGCAWVRPGFDGEYIPKKSMKEYTFVSRKKADLCFRGQCIEGAVSFEHVRDAILWMPKINSNLFMIQFIVPYNLMSRWYKHSANTVKESEDASFEQIAEYIPKIEALVKKCGLSLHSLGHGYLFSPYGITYKTRDDVYEYSEKCLSHTALVNGKRGIFHGSPNFTQLCYSNPEVRQGLVDFLVSYANQRPYIDYLHIWLADYVNNNCECDECVKLRPSDYYVMLLNELDEALTKSGNDVRLVLISYTETLWPPIKARLNNPERFTLNAACSRLYNESYTDKRYYDKLPEYKRNSFKPLLDFSKIMSHTDAWGQVCGGKKFLFDYFLYTNHFCDPADMGVARDLYRDMKNVPMTGFDGVMSCQTQRAAFPTALPTAIFTETLYDQSIDFEKYTKDYFKSAYGEDYGLALDYLNKITELFEPDVTRAGDSIEAQDTGASDGVKMFGIKNRPDLAKKLEKIEPIADDFEVVAKNHRRTSENVCHKRSWELLEYHSVYVKHVAKIYIALALGDTVLAKEKLASAVDELSRMEDDIHREFDLCLWYQRMSQIIAK